MTPKSIHPQTAVTTFLERLVDRAFNEAISSLNENLQYGPAGHQPPQHLKQLSEWYKSLDTANQTQVQALIHETAYSVLFGVLVLLDGLTGGDVIEGETSDFALYLQTYEDEAARAANLAKTSLRLNGMESGEYLHDLLPGIIQQKGIEVGNP